MRHRIRMQIGLQLQQPFRVQSSATELSLIRKKRANTQISLHLFFKRVDRRGGKNSQKSIQKKDLNDLDNHEGVIAHLQPDILECEVKWALGSITSNEDNGGDGIPAELFKIPKDCVVKVLNSICQ